MHLVRAMRPRQWTKNVLVFAGLIFGQKLTDPASAQVAITAFIVFCLLSSSVYLLNDVHDREADRLHPAKASRPIASGALSIGAAIGAAAVLAAVALGTAFWINYTFGAVASRTSSPPLEWPIRWTGSLPERAVAAIVSSTRVARRGSDEVG